MRFILFCILSLHTGLIICQLSTPGTPHSFLLKKKSSAKIPETKLDALDISSLKKNDSIEGITNRFAQIQYVDIDIKRDGLKTPVNGTGTIWRYTIGSENAVSLGIAFSQFYLPEGASVFIYDENKIQVLGAFTSLNNKENNYLKIAEIIANKAIIEYFEPLGAAFSGILTISEISKAYKEFFSAEVLQNDINCREWQNLSEVKGAICRMIYTSGEYSYYCTGALINNTNYDETPYFLTAEHCINNQSEAASLITYFNYETAGCGGAIPVIQQTLSGASLKASYSPTDFSLLHLSEAPPRSYKPFYAGWDITDNLYSGVYAVHHPKGTVKKAAFSIYRIQNVPFTIPWDVGPSSPPNTHWEISFTNGSTESGSSGSPLLSPDLRIIGQLHGGDDKTSYYGKLSKSWYTGSDTRSLRPWLDPSNSQVKSLNGLSGYSIPEAGFRIYPLKACINAPIDLIDTSLNSPTDWNWNINTEPENYEFVESTSDESQFPKIVFKKPGTYQVTLIVSNKNGSSELSKNLQADTSIDLQIIEAPQNQICAYQLNGTQITATGAANYSFEVLPSQKIDTITNYNSLYINLKNEAFSDSSFVQQVIVNGKHGNCLTSEKVEFLVKVPAYDRIVDAKNIPMGQSGPFNNECASVDIKEPHPGDGGCLLEDTWCYDPSNKAVINNTLWFKFKGPNNGLISIKSSGFDTRIAMYKASSAQDLTSGIYSRYTLIAANDNTSASQKEASLVNIKVVPQDIYWLQVDGYKADTGDLLLNLYNEELEIFPNPSTGIFNFMLARNEETTGTLEVFSNQGSLVFKTNLINNPQNIMYLVDLQSLSTGLYIARITLAGKQYIKKLVIAR